MTLEEFIRNEHSKNFHMEDCFYKQLINQNQKGVRPQLILESSILDQFYAILRPYRVRVYVSPKQQNNYRYNPKKLALETYGSIEYWFLILLANEMFSCSQFSMDKKYIYLYSSGIQKVINEIRNVMRDFIDLNSEEVANDILKLK